MGRLASHVTENGAQTSYIYDAAGRTVRIIDALGHETQYSYDANGNVTSVSDARGTITTYEYDALDRRTRTRFPDGTERVVTYDAMDRRVEITDQAEQSTQLQYNALGNLTSITNALGYRTSFAYDELGNMLTQTDANGHVTRWNYDNQGHLIRRTLPEGMSESFTYDANGNVLTHTNFNGQTIQMAYDQRDLLAQKTFANSSVITYSYTPTGQLKTVTDQRGITRYMYDLRDRQLQVSHPDGNFIQYTYNAAGQRTSVTHPTGGTTYTYDLLNRLITTADSSGQGITVTYDGVGNRVHEALSNGTERNYTYDTLNRLVGLEHLQSDATLITRYDYTLGLTGNRLQVNEADGLTATYVYDRLSRLIQETISSPTTGIQTIDYIYDAVGNQISKTTNVNETINFSYDTNDRLLSAGNLLYSYDDNGNTLSQTNSSSEDKFFQYDQEKRLVQVDTPGTTIFYSYDADGNRIRSTINGDERRYLVDANREFAQVLEEQDSSGNTIVTYSYGERLISQTRGGSLSFYHYDGLGSTRALTDENGVITDTYVYSAYGSIFTSNGATPNLYLFAGEHFNAESGLYYLRARYYNPAIGRFISQDPVSGLRFEPLSLHTYLYANANPTNFTDPSGQLTLNSLLVKLQVFAFQITGFVPPTFVIVQRLRYGFLTPKAVQALVQAGRIAPGSRGTQMAIQRLIKQVDRSVLAQWSNGAKSAQSHFFTRMLSEPERFIEISNRLGIAQFRLGYGGFERFTRVAQNLGAYGQSFISRSGNITFLRTQIVNGTSSRVGSADIGVAVIRNSSGQIQSLREVVGQVVLSQ